MKPLWIEQLLQTPFTLIKLCNQLQIISADRCIAVCFDGLKILRKSLVVGCITAAAWIVCLGICVPAMLYSHTVGIHPNCYCR